MAESSGNPNPTSPAMIRGLPFTVHHTTTATETSNTLRDTQTGITSSDAEASLQHYHAASLQGDPIPSTRASQASSLTQLGSLFDNDHSDPSSFPTSIPEDDLVPSQESSQVAGGQSALQQQSADEASMLLLASTPSVEQAQVNVRSAINTARPDSPSALITSPSTQPTRYEDVHAESSPKTPSTSAME